MRNLLIKILYSLVWVLSLLPFRVLYFFSDILYAIIYYLVGYRKKIVRKNLTHFFPDKSPHEIVKIEKKFYRHFADILVETLKSFSISEAAITKRFTVTHTEIIDELYQQKKSIILMGSHYGNWEWLMGLGKRFEHTAYATYTKINNSFLDTKIKANRERFDVNLILKQHTARRIKENFISNKLSMYGLLSDQSPQVRRAYYWTHFMGAQVPVFTGAENFAKEFEMAVVYLEITKQKRGHYNCDFQLITDNPEPFKKYEITNLYLKKVEKLIRQKPEHYLWTHDRLKHVGKEHLKPKKAN
jgi:KDO2-lipid IV(A) lauroyltransferase